MAFSTSTYIYIFSRSKNIPGTPSRYPCQCIRPFECPIQSQHINSGCLKEVKRPPLRASGRSTCLLVLIVEVKVFLRKLEFVHDCLCLPENLLQVSGTKYVFTFISK